MSMTNKPVEPSMEEILASIRKIIAEEPIGTRPDPVNQAPKASARTETAQKLGPAPEALAIDDVLDMAGGAGLSTGGVERNGAVSKGTDGGWSLGKPAGAAAASGAAARQASHAMKPLAANGVAGNLESARSPARGEEIKPAAPDRSDTFGATIPGRAAETDASGDRSAAVRQDVALSEARQKVERHLGTLPDVAERPAPLGLRSIREPVRPDTTKSAAGGLVARVAATQAPAEPVAVDTQAALGDKGRAVSGSVGAAATVANPPAKQAVSTPAAKTEHVEARGAEARTAAVAATPAAAAAKAEAAKAAAGNPKPSLEEAVAEMLRPMLSTWLDTNLPRIVQDVVREQMAKAPLPGTDKPAG